MRIDLEGKARLIDTIVSRLKELSAYALVHQRNIEPYRYPRGLFCVQNDPIKRYQMAAYINEMQDNLNILQLSCTPERDAEMAKKILQQITVLTVSMKSQKLRPHKRSTLGSLFDTINQTESNAFHYFCEKEKQTQKDSILVKMKEKQSSLALTNLMMDRKKIVLEKTTERKKQLTLKKEYDLLKEEQDCLVNEVETMRNHLEQT